MWCPWNVTSEKRILLDLISTTNNCHALTPSRKSGSRADYKTFVVVVLPSLDYGPLSGDIQQG